MNDFYLFSGVLGELWRPVLVQSIFDIFLDSFAGFGASRERDQWDQMASRAKSIYLNSWILEDMSTCPYIGRSIFRYVNISV